MRALQSVALLSWGVAGNGNAGNGNYPECQIAPLAEDLIDDEYKIFYDEPITFEEARAKCHEFGEFWDLVIFNYEREHTRINKVFYTGKRKREWSIPVSKVPRFIRGSRGIKF